ncbi:hypothetical protein ACFFRR_010246 [Megaselia abdita]
MSIAYTSQEVAVNNGQDGKPVWMIIKGKVYDVTPFINSHPGGSELLMEYAGKDATKAFNRAGHSADACKDLKNYEIGELIPNKVDTSVQNCKKIEEMDACTKQKKRIKLFFCF